MCFHAAPFPSLSPCGVNTGDAGVGKDMVASNADVGIGDEAVGDGVECLTRGKYG
jgi:hypothetical protein